MAYVALASNEVWYPQLWRHSATFAYTVATIDATGEKVAFNGRVWIPARASTKAIQRVGFQFGTVVKAGGSALTVSLQNVSAATAPMQPDETQDQTVAIANADAGFVSDTWYRTGTLSADRTVTFGDLMSIVVEYDGGGRLGADTVQIRSQATIASGYPFHQTTTALKTASFASVASALPLCILEMSDGTFGILDGAVPFSAFGSVSIDTGTAFDEYALRFSVPHPMKIDGLAVIVDCNAATSDFDLILYEGTTPMVTTSIDATQVFSASLKPLVVTIAEQTLVAGTVYYLSVKPTTANNVDIYYGDVFDANHFSAYGGTAFHLATRVDATAWTPTTTRRPMGFALRVSAVDDGAGAAGGMMRPVPMSGGLV